jgi:apolipoprotein D and lipocalin family protein
MFRKLFRKIRDIRGPETVPQVDVQRYCGTWYEIAAIPVRREANCTDVKAEYTLDPARSTVIVQNSCRRNGRTISIRATAVPVPGTGNAKLIVTFFRFIKADYWVIGLDEDYSWALVSNPKRTHCWILSRTPYLEENLYPHLLELLQQKGIDVSKVVRSVHG